MKIDIRIPNRLIVRLENTLLKLTGEDSTPELLAYFIVHILEIYLDAEENESENK